MNSLKTNASRILVRAPSNIALVKYMGKRADAEARNLPENASISMTLSRLCTFVELRPYEANGGRKGLRWIAEAPAGVAGEPPKLDEKGVEKFLAHARWLVNGLVNGLTNGSTHETSEPDLEIRTSNTFPHAAGIASSASSFAALTLAMKLYLSKDREAFRRRYREDAKFRAELATLSREGSGSSCRSFDGPFVEWEGKVVRALSSSLPSLSDLIVVVSANEKKVGSSEAHRRVKSSPEWAGRIERANHRVSEIRRAIAAGDFIEMRSIAEADSEDMHRLFETSEPPFSYVTPESRSVWEFAGSLRTESGSPITVARTMDAGPNVHLLVSSSEEEFVRRALVSRFPEYPVLVDRQGGGAEILETGVEEPSNRASSASSTTLTTVNWTSYSTSVPGKWVLSGEHTVLRGGRAIALPHPEYSLKLEFRAGGNGLSVEPEFGAKPVENLLRIAGEWLARRGISLDPPQGSLRVRTTIPFGAGLGSSAALSVALARWILSAHSLDRSLERELAREMEDHFHGKSSGMDIAAVSIGEPILYSMVGGAVGLGLRHLPKFSFFDTGLRASTLECVARVDGMRALDSALGEALDRRMTEATSRILEGLRAYDEAIDRGEKLRSEEALREIEAGMRASREVFAAWGLLPKEIEAEIARLEKQGLRGARLTGAGGGGFVVGFGEHDQGE